MARPFEAARKAGRRWRRWRRVDVEHTAGGASRAARSSNEVVDVEDHPLRRPFLEDSATGHCASSRTLHHETKRVREPFTCESKQCGLRQEFGLRSSTQPAIGPANTGLVPGTSLRQRVWADPKWTSRAQRWGQGLKGKSHALNDSTTVIRLLPRSSKEPGGASCPC
jgi:hypothetical protein